MYWMGDQKCTKIQVKPICHLMPERRNAKTFSGTVSCSLFPYVFQSFGGLYHFKASQAPSGAAATCDGCPAERDCPYSAKKIYVDMCPKECERERILRF